MKKLLIATVFLFAASAMAQGATETAPKQEQPAATKEMKKPVKKAHKAAKKAHKAHKAKKEHKAE